MTPTLIPNRVRVLFYTQKQPSLSFEEFSEQWRAHAPAFLATKAAKENLLKYEQWHANQEFKQMLLGAGMKVPDYDGVVVVEAETVEKVLAAFSGSEYNEKVLPNSAKFVNSNTIAYRAFQITSVFDKSSADRKGVGAVLVNMHTKNGTESGKYWREVHIPKLVSLMESTGLGGSLMKNEVLTGDLHISGNLPAQLTPASWDGVSVVEAPSVGEILHTYNDQRFIDFSKEDLPNFIDVSKPSEFMPCNVFAFEI
ncbi:hypothetical protein V5O48_004099 [Marasmius crinis-equi]|uniref:EthD domain-containing protein n=1 Tax=Marasmius crinis-equi TaxID=585013 RepID=A0ABR3FR40_9AGAR